MAAPTIVGVGAAASGTTGAVTAAYPAAYTPIDNDVGCILQECENSDTPTNPSGWAQITQASVTTGTTTKLTAFWRRIVAGDTAPSVPAVANHQVVRMIVLRGCKISGNPWNSFGATNELASDTTVSIPGGTTTVPDCLCLFAFGTGQDTASTAGATGWTNAGLTNLAERMDNWVTAGLGGGFAMATGERAPTGAVPATTATLSLTANFKTLLYVAFAPEPLPTIVIPRWV